MAAAGELLYTYIRTILETTACTIIINVIVVSTSSWLKSLCTSVADTYHQLELTSCSVRHVKIRPYKTPIV